MRALLAGMVLQRKGQLLEGLPEGQRAAVNLHEAYRRRRRKRTPLEFLRAAKMPLSVEELAAYLKTDRRKVGMAVAALWRRGCLRIVVQSGIRYYELRRR
jgi:hypothetical protein